MEFSTNQQTKYYALQILESVIKTRWKVLPRNQCEGIKKYIVGLIIKTSSDQALMEKEKTYLNKLNMILVQVYTFVQVLKAKSTNTYSYYQMDTFR